MSAGPFNPDVVQDQRAKRIMPDALERLRQQLEERLGFPGSRVVAAMSKAVSRRGEQLPSRDGFRGGFSF